MQPSQANTMSLPTSGSPDPATLMKAAHIPLRVVVRNTGPNLVLIAFDPSTLSQQAPSANTFKLPVDRTEVFVLAPEEGIYAVAIGIGGEVSITASEALPKIWMES